MARTKVTPKKEREGKKSAQNTRGVQNDFKEGKKAPLSCTPPLPSQKALTHEGGGADIGWGWEVGWGG